MGNRMVGERERERGSMVLSPRSNSPATLFRREHLHVLIAKQTAQRSADRLAVRFKFIHISQKWALWDGFTRDVVTVNILGFTGPSNLIPSTEIESHIKPNITKHHI